MQIQTPIEKLYHWTAKNPHQTFLRQPYNGEWLHYSWKRVDDEVRRMAAYLRSLNLAPQSKIAIISKNCAHWIMSDLAIMMAGHISVPLYPTIPAELIRYCLEHCEAKVAFIGKLDAWSKQRSGLPDNVKGISYPLWTEEGYENWDDIIAKNEPYLENYIPDDAHISTIIYTSGTTGLPKGVVHSFHTFSYAAGWALTEINDITEKDRFFSYLPLSHIAERMLVEMGALYSGGSISFAESLDLFAANLKDTKPSVFLAVPRIWTKFQMGILSKMPQKRLNILLKIPIVNKLIQTKIKQGLGLDKAKYVLTGAAPLPVATMVWFDKLGIDICEAYAMTENCAYSHLTRRGNKKLGTVGTPMPNCEIRIADDGEIQVKNEAIMLEYFKEPEKTQEALTQDGFLRTGDQGEIDENNFLKITGRVKDIFKTDKGKYVAPAPIELELSKNTNIEQVCVVGMNLPQTMALLVLSAEAKALDKAVLEADLVATMQEVNKKFEKHERMKKLVVMQEEWTVDNNYITPTLKVKRNILEKDKSPYYEKWYKETNEIIWE
ncbi:MAG: AMP-binding protein [Chitinophagales bacterium]|jgi:long-chain acyl-CoA synthetase|nr:AMP-binding protein [Chitinophagales bacterium]